MPVKCKSEQIATEQYIYTCAAGENIFLPMKARRNEVLIIHNISIYNTSQDNSGTCYKILRRRGILYRLNYVGAINAGVVHRWGVDIYLIDGDEMGIAYTPNAAGDTVQLVMQALRFRDDEYNQPT